MYIDEKLVVFGAGKASKNIFQWLKDKNVSPVAVIDNNPSLWGKEVQGFLISPPNDLVNFTFDKIIISSSKYFDEISNSFINNHGITKDKILRPNALVLEDVLDFYDKNPNLIDSSEKELLLERIRLLDDISPFNYPFASKEARLAINVEVHFDETCSLFYAIYNNKRMYMSRKYKDKDAVVNYVRSIIVEQHKNSPHRYLADDFTFTTGTALDAGVAEGNFALDVLDKASRLVLVEAEPLWCEALEHTFASYKDKVVIINKFLSDKDSADSVTIDSLSKTYDFDFIKMDIEGAEMSALSGGKNTLKKNKDLKLAVCAYHRFNDERDIKDFLSEYGFEAHTTHGYMVFPFSSEYPKRFVRGVIRARKTAIKIPNVYIWGKGKMSALVLSAIRKDMCNFCGFIDKNTELNDCLKPQDLQQCTFDYIVISAKNSGVIIKQAETLGIQTEKLVDFWNIETFPAFIDENVKKIFVLEEKLKFYKRCTLNAPYEYGAKTVPTIRSSEELLHIIVHEHASLCRFGDGEFEMMLQKERPWFQKPDENLSKRLREIVISHDDNIKIALLSFFGNLEPYTKEAANGMREYMLMSRDDIMPMLDLSKTYYNGYVSRAYIIYKDKATI